MVALGVAEGVTTEAGGVTNIAGGVLVTLVADASLLLTVIGVVVTGDGVKSDVDLAGVVAPLVIDGFLCVEMVVGAPLVPGIVGPLVVALALMATLSVGGVSIDSIVTAVTTVGAVALLVTVGLVVNTVSLGLLVVVAVGIGLVLLVPRLNGDESCSESNKLEHF